MGAITRSVGAGGANNPADVTEIQQLLNKIPAAKGGTAPPFVVFGTCNSATLAAILKFQKMQVPAFADGRVDPGGPTLTKMIALAGPPGPSPIPAAAKGSLTDVTRARGIAQTWLTAVEPSITGFIFSVSKGLTYAQAGVDFEDNLQLAFATTVRKAQGSDFDTVFLVLPRDARNLSRELLYTAITIVLGSRFGRWSEAIYFATGVVLVWYTVETHAMRREMTCGAS